MLCNALEAIFPTRLDVFSFLAIVKSFLIEQYFHNLVVLYYFICCWSNKGNSTHFGKAHFSNPRCRRNPHPGVPSRLPSTRGEYGRRRELCRHRDRIGSQWLSIRAMASSSRSMLFGSTAAACTDATANQTGTKTSRQRAGSAIGQSPTRLSRFPN